MRNLYKRATKHLPDLSMNQFLKYLGCDARTLVQHLQVQFRKRIGFCWQNYATVWEMDHIIPINKLKEKLGEAATVLHFRNLQPLTKTENEKKKANGDEVDTRARVHLFDRGPIAEDTDACLFVRLHQYLV